MSENGNANNGSSGLPYPQGNLEKQATTEKTRTMISRMESRLNATDRVSKTKITIKSSRSSTNLDKIAEEIDLRLARTM